MDDRYLARQWAAAHTPEDIRACNDRFRHQVATLGLVYDCRSCVHYDEDGRRCSLEFPTDLLDRAAADGRAVTDEGDLVFCKYFEVS